MTYAELIKLHGSLREFQMALDKAVADLFITVEEAMKAYEEYSQELQEAECFECKQTHRVGWGLTAEGRAAAIVPCIACRKDDYERVMEAYMQNAAHALVIEGKRWVCVCGCDLAMNFISANREILSCAACFRKVE